MRTTFPDAARHAYARFRRALDARNATGALAAAHELAHVGLADALELCLLLRDHNRARFERAALRWAVLFFADTCTDMA